MSLETLDRTLWSYAEALKHVQTVTVARRAVEAARRPAETQVKYPEWHRPQDPAVKWKAEAETELLVALRDGDLHARGRYTESGRIPGAAVTISLDSVSTRAITPASGPSNGGREASRWDG